MEILKETSRLAVVSGTTVIGGAVAIYLPVVTEEEANTVVGVPPFQELVVRREVETERGCTQETVQLGGIDQGRYSFMALYYMLA